MWKAFDEMERLGWIGSARPRMVVVQAEGCAPIVRAFEQGANSAPLFPNARTAASGLRVPAAVGDFLMLDILRKSGGTAITISDEELMQGVYELARVQGVHAAPEGGAVWRAAVHLRESGWLQADETVVLFNTGAAVKYNHLLTCDDALRLDHTSAESLNQLERSLTSRGFV
jgi:threonine synthase